MSKLTSIWYPFCSYEAIDGSNNPENSWKLILSSKSKSKVSVEKNQEIGKFLYCHELQVRYTILIRGNYRIWNRCRAQHPSKECSNPWLILLIQIDPNIRCSHDPLAAQKMKKGSDSWCLHWAVQCPSSRAVLVWILTLKALTRSVRTSSAVMFTRDPLLLAPCTESKDTELISCENLGAGISSWFGCG